MRIPLYYVNAFTSTPFAGNPAAVCLLNSWLDDEVLRKVATENNLSATAFLIARAEGYELRWFTSRCEIRLCGHATLAAGRVLLSLLRPELDHVSFETRYRGTLTVKKDGDLLSMDLPAFPVMPLGTMPEDFIRALRVDSRLLELLKGNDTYFAVYDSAETILSIQPDIALLERLHPFAVCVTAAGGEAVDFSSRYFAPSYGTPEDPVTGSAHCALAPYWANRLGKSRLHACQLSKRGGELWCQVSGDRVVVSGNAVVTLEGTLTI